MNTTTIKSLEAIYGRSENIDVSIYKNKQFYVSIGEGANRVAISDCNFDNILHLLRDVLKNAVSMVGENEEEFLKDWENEPGQGQMSATGSAPLCALLKYRTADALNWGSQINPPDS